MSSQSLLDFLGDPRSHANSPPEIGRRETDLSWLFFVGPVVYKVKKAVKINGVDYSTRASREKACLREVRLNQRLSPELGEQVVPLYESETGWSFSGRGAATELCLKMRRLPAERMLDRLVSSREAAPSDIEAVSEVLADFYLEAKTSERVGRAGSATAIESNVRSLLKGLREIEPEAPDLDRVESALLEFIAIRHDVFERRIESGKIRDVHGDLRLEHICIEHRPIILGCMESSDRARHVDILADIAGLVIEFDRAGRSDLGKHFWHSLARKLGENPADPLFDFYLAYQAALRARHEGSRSSRLADAQGKTGHDRRHEYLALAGDYCRRFHQPRLFATVGLMGTGKTTLSAALAQTMGLERIAAEQVALKMFSERKDRRTRANDQADAIYDEMIRQALMNLSKGASVILDARFLRRSERTRIMDLARAAGAAPLFLECRLSQSDAIARLDQRFRKDRSKPGARPELYDEQRKIYEPLDEIPRDAVLSVNTTQPVPDLVDTVLEKLAPSNIPR